MAAHPTSSVTQDPAPGSASPAAWEAAAHIPPHTTLKYCLIFFVYLYKKYFHCYLIFHWACVLKPFYPLDTLLPM